MTSGQTQWNGWHPNLLACISFRPSLPFPQHEKIMSIEKNKVDMFWICHSWLYITKCICCFQTIWPCLHLKLGSIFLLVMTKKKKKKENWHSLFPKCTFSNNISLIHFNLTSNKQEEFSYFAPPHLENNFKYINTHRYICPGCPRTCLKYVI